MGKNFQLQVDNISLKESNDSDFLYLKIYAISDGVNRNNQEFLLEGFEKQIPTFYNKPILAYFNKKLNDTEEHNSDLDIDEFGNVFYDYDYETAEKPVGVIPESQKIYVEKVDGRSWIVIENAVIWTEYNHRLSELIKKYLTKKVSVEIESLDQEILSNGVEQIKQFKFCGVTILGKYKDGTPVEEGIEGAHLQIKKFAQSDSFKKYMFNFNNAFNNNLLNKYFKVDIGSGPKEKVNESKEAVQHDPWGEVNKQELRDKVLRAQNYKQIVGKVYLYVGQGWESSPSENLKYPVMQYKDGEFVYNANGLLSAQQYGEQHDEFVAKKAKQIRKKLGLLKPDKEEMMLKFIEKAKESGYVFVGLFGNKLGFVKMEEACEDKEMESKEELSLYMIDKEECSMEEDDEKEFASEGLDCKPLKMAEEDEKEDEEDEDDDDEEEEEDKEEFKCSKEEYEQMKAELESCKQKMAEQEEKVTCAEKERDEAKEELKKMKDEQFACEMEEFLKEECATENECEEFKRMNKEGKFSSKEDYEKEFAYRRFIKESQSRRSSFSYSSNKPKENEKSASETLSDKLAKI